MADFPALPLWTDAYLADTRLLTTLQHGAYLLLLMEAWRRPSASLPDDDSILAKLAGISPSEWSDLKPVVMSFWKLDSRTKTWSQKRLTKEKSYVTKSRKKQQSNAKSRWNKDKTSSHGNAKPDAKAMPNECQNDAPTTHNPQPTTHTLKGGVEEVRAATSQFKEIEARLWAVEGVKGTNLEMSPLTPIVLLVQDGFDLDGEIIPLVKADIARASPEVRRKMLSWSTIANRCREKRNQAISGAKQNPLSAMPAPQQVSEQDWLSRLSFARSKKAWEQAKWGPYPNQAGCLVPEKLIEPSDGKGWQEWSVVYKKEGSGK